jgi:hypothetical protein
MAPRWRPEIKLEFKMQTFMIAAGLLAAAVSTAEAKCSMSSLNGKWWLRYDSSTTLVTVADGTLNALIIGKPIKMKLSENCRGKSTISYDAMTTYPVWIAAERIAKTSTMKPNVVMFTIEHSPGSGAFYQMSRAAN